MHTETIRSKTGKTFISDRPSAKRVGKCSGFDVDEIMSKACVATTAAHEHNT